MMDSVLRGMRRVCGVRPSGGLDWINLQQFGASKDYMRMRGEKVEELRNDSFKADTVSFWRENFYLSYRTSLLLESGDKNHLKMSTF